MRSITARLYDSSDDLDFDATPAKLPEGVRLSARCILTNRRTGV
jgi:hypothetical protein